MAPLGIEPYAVGVDEIWRRRRLRPWIGTGSFVVIGLGGAAILHLHGGGATVADEPNPTGYSLRVPSGWRAPDPAGRYPWLPSGYGAVAPPAVDANLLLVGPHGAQVRVEVFPASDNVRFGWPSIYTFVPKGSVDIHFAGQTVAARSYDIISGPAEGQGPTSREVDVTASHRMNGVVQTFHGVCWPGTEDSGVCADLLDSWRWEDAPQPAGVHGGRVYR